jgi:hypothetical protein
MAGYHPGARPGCGGKRRLGGGKGHWRVPEARQVGVRAKLIPFAVNALRCPHVRQAQRGFDATAPLLGKIAADVGQSPFQEADAIERGRSSTRAVTVVRR